MEIQRSEMDAEQTGFLSMQQKGLMLMSATPDMIFSLLSDRTRFFARNPSSVILPAENDPDRCYAAMAAYGYDEIGQLIALVDTSAVQNGKCGILFGEFGLCYDFGWADSVGCFYYDSILRLDYTRSGFGRKESLIVYTDGRSSFSMLSSMLNMLELGFVLEGICERELLHDAGIHRPFVIVPPPPGVRPIVHRPMPPRRTPGMHPAPMRFAPAPHANRAPAGGAGMGAKAGMNRNSPKPNIGGNAGLGGRQSSRPPQKGMGGSMGGRSSSPSRPSQNPSGFSAGKNSGYSGNRSGYTRPSTSHSGPSRSGGGFGGGSGHGGGAGRR